MYFFVVLQVLLNQLALKQVYCDHTKKQLNSWMKLSEIK